MGKQKTPKPTTEPESFGLLLASVRSGLIRRCERLLASHGFDLNFTQLRVMRALGEGGPMRATELARLVEHDGGALTRVLDRLQEKGYVSRRPNAADRRAIEVVMTEDGRAAWNSMKVCVTELYSGVFAVLSEAEQAQLFSLLNRIRDHLESDSER